MMKIGDLALQGAFIEHEKMLASLGAESFEIRQLKDIGQPMDGLIIPGGESTVQGKLLREAWTHGAAARAYQRRAPGIRDMRGAYPARKVDRRRRSSSPRGDGHNRKAQRLRQAARKLRRKRRIQGDRQRPDDVYPRSVHQQHTGRRDTRGSRRKSRCCTSGEYSGHSFPPGAHRGHIGTQLFSGHGGCRAGICGGINCINYRGSALTGGPFRISSVFQRTIEITLDKRRTLHYNVLCIVHQAKKM